ncbi:MAG: prepilin-type N-terminal cleavage/methylation domain-containing protein [Verrucomicrobiota bacterium]
MTTESKYSQGFSLLELLMAMAVFAIAAVSLSQALSMISLSVVESIESAELREQMHGLLLEEGRNSRIREGVRKTEELANGVFFEVEVTRFDAQNREGEPLNNLFEVTVTAFRRSSSEGTIELSSAATLVNSTLLQAL